MDIGYCTTQLRRSSDAIRQMVEGLPDEQARWKPDATSLSILEVINHLHDEEREDFRDRLDLILHRPDQTWTPSDPEGWVTARRYNQRDPEESLHNFLRERRASLARLEDLRTPDWQATYQAPWGPITAGDVFASWVAHDLLHMRQIVELLYAYTVKRLQPYRVDYAGPW